MEVNRIEDRVKDSIQSMESHGRQIALVFGSLALAILGVWAFSTWRERGAETTLAATYALEQQLGANASPEKKAEQLKAYETAVSEHGSRKEAALLRLRYANLLLEEGNFSEAEKQLQKVRGHFGRRSAFQGLFLLHLARSAEGQKAWAKAKAYLEEALKLEPNPQKDFILFALGRVEEKAGETDNAKTRYAAIAQDFADSPLASRARERSAALDGAVAKR